MARDSIIEPFDWIDAVRKTVLGNRLNRIAIKTRSMIEAFLEQHYADGTHKGGGGIAVGGCFVDDLGGEPVTWAIRNGWGVCGSGATVGTGVSPLVVLNKSMMETTAWTALAEHVGGSAYYARPLPTAASTVRIYQYNSSGNAVAGDFILLIYGPRKNT